MLISSRFLAFLTLYFFPFTLSARLKFQFHPSQKNYVASRLPRATETFCDSLKSVNKSTLTVPTFNTSAPWKNDRVDVWRSSGAKKAFDDILAERVHCLYPEYSFLEVFKKFEQEACWILPFGGAVRDVIRGKPLHDIDAESSCSPSTTREACEKHFGDQCWDRGSRILHVGGSQDTSTKMDVANWDSTFFGDGTSLEFSTNCMAYDWNQDVIIDLSTHTGPRDSCDSKIRIPVVRALWDSWINAPGPDKSVRFWKLRGGKGYHAADEETQSFMNDHFKNLAATDEGKDTLRKYYCYYALKGTKFNHTEDVCTTSNDCSLLNGFDAAYIADLGIDFWKSTLKPLFKTNMKCVHGEQKECVDRSLAPKHFSNFGMYLSLLLALAMVVV